MTSMTCSPVQIQTSPQSVPSTPSWFGEVALMAHYLSQRGLLEQIEERVRFARARFGIYDTIDFVVVLIGYALSGEATLQSFYERLLPFALPFMALFAREQLPSRSALSRFLKAVDQPTVESLRTLFQEDLLGRPLTAQRDPQAGLQDRCGKVWEVFDADGTRQAARQRALPQTPALPPAHRRMDQVCAAGYTGRKRGEVVRTRTTLLLAHTQQWFATFGNAGNGDYRGELLRVIGVLTQYAIKHHLPLSRIILRLDGQYGDVAVIIDLASRGVCYLTRGKDYGLLDLPAVQARLALPPDQVSTHPETGTGRALFDCAEISLPGTGLSTRVIVATHPATSTTAPIGVTRDGIVYELFFTALPQVAFSPADVIDLYLHRGAFETVLGEEDAEQDSDRWVSQAPNGQEFWQIVSQWVWNLRLELGHHLDPAPVRLTEFAPAQPSAASEEADGQEDPLACTLATSSPLLTCDPHEDPADEQPALDCQEQPSAPFVYGPPQFTQTRRAGKFAGADFQLQPDGTLRCPANHLLYAEARRPEHDGTVRVLYAARLPDCRGCLLAEHCLLHGKDNTGPRRVSAVIRPTGEPPPLPSSSWEPPAPATLPILWGDCRGHQSRQALIRLLHTQTVTVTVTPNAPVPFDPPPPVPLMRAQRAHWRLSWAQRLARNAASPLAPHVHIQIFGIPTPFAASVGVAAA